MPETPSFEKATLAWTLPWQDTWVTAVTFIGATRKLAAGNRNGQILVWDLPEQPAGDAPVPVRRLDGHTNEVTRLVATPDGKTLISASYDHTIRYWDTEAPASGSAEVILDARSRAVAAKKLGNKAPPPAPGVQVGLQQAIEVVEAHKDWVLGLSLTRDGKTLLSGDDAGNVILWDRPAVKERRRWKIKHWVWGAALSPDATLALIAERLPLSATPTDRHFGLKIWDATTGQVKHDLAPQYKLDERAYIGAADFSPDGKLLALAEGGEGRGMIFLVESATGKKVRELAGHKPGGVHDLHFSTDGKYLFSSGRDTLVRVWSVADGKQTVQLGKPRGAEFKDICYALSLSADEHWLAVADMAGQVMVYRA
jgi:WD40 repeat protein